MKQKYKDIVFESYMACMEKRATEEQELIWGLANAVHCVRTRLENGDTEYANKIMHDLDYTIGQ